MKAEPLIVYIPDRRDVEISSRYTAGNNKIGYNVFTYSRLAGKEHFTQVPGESQTDPRGRDLGTCPGSSPECEAICYAKRIGGVVKDIYITNSATSDVPSIPGACRLLRIHVSGDFDTPEYISNWIVQLKLRPDVTAWAYTKSWRVPDLLPALERLRALPNMQLFASMDASMLDVPPVGWRRAWIMRTTARDGFPLEARLDLYRQPRRVARFEGEVEEFTMGEAMTRCNVDNTPSYVCPEETGRKPDCVSCGYCFEGQKHDVTFLEH